MCVYNNILYVFTASAVYAVQSGTLVKVDINYQSMADLNNGCVQPSSIHSCSFRRLWLERLSGTSLDDVGPNRDAGLPSGRQGCIADMAAAVDALYLNIDAGDVDTSAVYTYNNFGHHELCRRKRRASARGLSSIKSFLGGLIVCGTVREHRYLAVLCKQDFQPLQGCQHELR